MFRFFYDKKSGSIIDAAGFLLFTAYIERLPVFFHRHRLPFHFLGFVLQFLFFLG
ncbi:hypothetical protein SAMN04488128_1021384 [Chitinophaga eiseniae]|uniref:Uncharacterized protein n=1 Tax=Chitinophaga eiseniae TaxID=634771 RepID=A0A1T4RPP2_9BACT|nr:hypothetical protein SAMN04488128_1021384 [Chitinophaga eiseniae]